MTRSKLYAICGLLMLASAINYMDRQTLANVGKRVTTEFTLTGVQFGALETSFGLSFAVGSLFFGILADRVPIRLLYPVVLLLWSAVGFITGLSQTYEQLLICRGFLGFFEAGHWPCGLKTTQALLAPGQRAMGNSVLQSGTSIGAIITPGIMFVTLQSTNSWRVGFQLVGAIGLLWIVAWFMVVRKSDLHHRSTARSAQSSDGPPWWHCLLTWRMLAVLIVVTIINASWQTLRGWLPKIMQEEYGYSENFTFAFTSVWYAITDVGCIASGALALWLVHQGWTIKYSRALTFGLCAILCSTLSLIHVLPSNWILLLVFLVSGAGALGMFPIFYSFSQDISREHQGKVTGVTGIIAWTLSSPTGMLFGWLKDTTNSYSLGLAIAGGIPLLALFAIIAVWPPDTKTGTNS